MWQSLGTGFAAYPPFGSQGGHLITGSRTRQIEAKDKQPVIEKKGDE